MYWSWKWFFWKYLPNILLGEIFYSFFHCFHEILTIISFHCFKKMEICFWECFAARILGSARLLNPAMKFVRKHCIEKLKYQVLLRILFQNNWLNNSSTWSSLYWYIIFTIVIISLLSHTRTGVVVLSIDISELLPLRGYICLNRTKLCSLCLIRRSVVVYLEVYLWTVSRVFVVYLAVSH